MRIGIEIDPRRDLEYFLELVRLAEDLGFPSVWSTDHYSSRDLFVSLALAAIRTRRIELGIGATNPYLRHPVILANSVATLNDLSGGRISVCLVPGDRVFLRRLGIDRRDVLRTMEETLTILRSLLRGEIVSYEGRIFELRNAYILSENPVRIYVGAMGPRMLELAKRLADGVLLNLAHPEDIELCLDLLGDRGNLRVGVYAPSCISEDREEALRLVKPIVAFVVASAHRTYLERHGMDPELREELERLLLERRYEDAGLLLREDIVEAFSIVGTISEIEERLEEYRKLGVDEVILGAPLGGNLRDSIRILGERFLQET